MPSTTIVLIVIAAAGVVFFLVRASRQRRAERAEEYRKAALLRGWQLETTAGDEQRYSGTTERVPWTAWVGRLGGTEDAKVVVRWETTHVRFDEGALVIWPNMGEAFQVFETPGIPKFAINLAMRPLAQALGAPGSDAELITSATADIEGPEGFLFRATDGKRMRDWLANGAARALEEDAEWLTKRTEQPLVIGMLWKHGLQLVTPAGMDPLDQSARVSRLGARLANAARTDRF